MAAATEAGKGGLLAKLRGRAAQQDEVADEQQQQLLLLFEKRNELKREFGRTLDELDQLKSAHAALRDRHQRYEQRLDGLEAMLADPQRGQNAIIYYRLDTLWKRCRQLLEQRRAELVEKFEQLEKQKQLEHFRANAVEQQRQLEKKFEQYDGIYQDMADNLRTLQERLRRSQKPWHYFRRRKLAVDIAAAEEQVAPVVAERDECLAELERVRDREPPQFKGLSVQARREINIQLLAMAQYLYVHFNENDLGVLARRTQEKHPGESHYGTPQECLAMEKPIRDAVVKLKNDEKRAEKLKRRADHLRQTVTFSGNSDTVPEPQSLARIVLTFGATSSSLDAVRGDVLVNVLEQGYWGVDGLLLEEAGKKK